MTEINRLNVFGFKMLARVGLKFEINRQFAIELFDGFYYKIAGFVRVE